MSSSLSTLSSDVRSETVSELAQKREDMNLLPPPPLSPRRTDSLMQRVEVVLCGDLGGTNSRLELFRILNRDTVGAEDLANVGKVDPVFKCTYKNDAVDGDFTHLLHQFLEDARLPHLELIAGCLAVAGPVSNDRVAFTNLSWVIDSRHLEQEFLMPHGSMRLINDFVANGYGVVTLDDDEYEDISPRGNVTATLGAPVACVGAGTGLGETYATCAPASRETSGVLRYDAWASEGGHVGFAPRDAIQRELLAYLSEKFSNERVSTERVVSGKGIVNVYDFLAQKFPDDVDQLLDSRIRSETEGAGIVASSVYDNKVCEQTMEIVLDAYGAELGNAAIKWLPFGGLYVAGGIAIKNLALIRHEGSAFYKAYMDRGRMSHVLDKIPLRLVTVDNLGLRGAHYVAITILIEAAVTPDPPDRNDTKITMMQSLSEFEEVPEGSDMQDKLAELGKIESVHVENLSIDEQNKRGGFSALEDAVDRLTRALVASSLAAAVTAIVCTAIISKRAN